ncbi:MAG: hypothetical protein JWN98_2329 [Abditibacteriota bacterium]|nr:hypothetical protein [Abditibacteriota bacterium]
MVMLSCRKCGSEVASDEKAKKCRNCGELFPFQCAVCSKHIRPPIPDFPVERYFTEDNRPLCQDHYQRQCPECNQWFRADENPGFFLCAQCAAKRGAQSAEPEETEEARVPKKSGCGAGVLMAIVGLSSLLYIASQAAFAAWH